MGALCKLHLNSHSPARRHCWLLPWKEEVGFLEVSVPLDSYGGERYPLALCLAKVPWLCAPARSCGIPTPEMLFFTMEIRTHALAFSLGVSPGRNRFPLEVSKSQFCLVASTGCVPTDQVNLARQLLGGVQMCPPGRGLQIIYGNLFYPQISESLRRLEKSFWISPSFCQRCRDPSSS